MTLLLRERDVHALLTMEAAIGLMADALRAFSTGGATQPVRTAMPIPAHAGYLGVMPAYLHAQGALGQKAVTFYPRNAERSLPTHLAVILLWNDATGELLAILDGRLITEMRTAAVSAVATRALARPHASVLALVGAGVQARSHLEALRLVRPMREVRVWSRTAATAARFADEMAERAGAPIHVAATVAEAAEGADLIVTATSSPTTVLRGEWIAPGAHVNAVGAPTPGWRELDTAAVARARVYVDSRAGALTEAGDLLMPMAEGAITEAHILGEIGEVLAGTVPGRIAPDDLTLFKSLGMAVEDVACARYVYEQALERGAGERITLA